MLMSDKTQQPHWLERYASDKYDWQSASANGRKTYYRPLGLVEFAFDADGRYYEGRADINASIELDFRSSLGKHDLRERILFAWTCLRCQHLLLQSKAIPWQPYMHDHLKLERDLYFAAEAPNTLTQAIEDGGANIVFLQDHYQDVNARDFWLHAQNIARLVDPDVALARLFVLPTTRDDEGYGKLRFLIVGSHQIWDGLTTYTWAREFVHLLNKPLDELRACLTECLEPKSVFMHLPLPQEALYPPVVGSPARKRWFWLLTRILRHVRKPLPAGFPNPLLRREDPKAATFSPVYRAVFDYTRIPPLNTTHCQASATSTGTQRLHRLCKEANVSIGAGCFALAALLMMEFHERLEPDVPLAERKPFITGFPLNPRPFLSRKTDPDSLMLAFSDGIMMPFLSSSLDLDGRIRLLARQAHRQLGAYQKRIRPQDNMTGHQYMSSRGAGRVLAIQYLSSIERGDALLPPELRKGINPQGAYPMRPNNTRQTCGVSSVGRRDILIDRNMYDLNDLSKDFVADYRVLNAGVRARDGEFLIGVAGTATDIGAGVSVDASSMDPTLVAHWQQRFRTILDEAPKNEIDSRAKL